MHRKIGHGNSYPIALLAGAALLLSACVPAGYPGQEPPPVTPSLAQDRAQPLLALAEQVLDGYFAADTGSYPTTCLMVRPTPLTAEQEEALILRFDRLAPAQRCLAQGEGHIDSITEQPAAVVQITAFDCVDGDPAGRVCSGWTKMPGQPAARHSMRFEQGEWRETADRQIIGE